MLTFNYIGVKHNYVNIIYMYYVAMFKMQDCTYK